ncbi:relaxase MobL [Nosocomiicoccus massiliensis]|uniref:relaxase MobL n=1 Tax=Nosocomiicoccus massiliensis TaxID=1232430 RepID=UPI0004071D42|nr:relaxase MobL [Nosocomiicoccus massiliensis]
MKAGVILTSDFVVGNKKSFENYIRYIDRKEAKQKDFPDEFEPIIDEKFEKYLDYMNRETAKQNNKQDKSTGLFNEKSDLLTKEERREVYKSFRTAQKNNSVLWRDVYSFGYTLVRTK